MNLEKNMRNIFGHTIFAANVIQFLAFYTCIGECADAT